MDIEGERLTEPTERAITGSDSWRMQQLTARMVGKLLVDAAGRNGDLPPDYVQSIHIKTDFAGLPTVNCQRGDVVVLSEEAA